MANKAMTLEKAIKLLITCAEEKRRREFAIGANLYLAGDRSICNVKAHEKYMEINEAIEVVTKNKISQLSLF